MGSRNIWVFPKNGGTPKWMVYKGKTLLKWMIWGVPNFWKHPFESPNCFVGEILTAWTCTLGRFGNGWKRSSDCQNFWWKLGGSDHLRSMSPSLVIKYMCNKIVIRHDLINLQGLSPNKCLALNGMCYLVGARHGGPRVVRVVHIFFSPYLPGPYRVRLHNKSMHPWTLRIPHGPHISNHANMHKYTYIHIYFHYTHFIYMYIHI